MSDDLDPIEVSCVWFASSMLIIFWGRGCATFFAGASLRGTRAKHLRPGPNPSSLPTTSKTKMRPTTLQNRVHAANQQGKAFARHENQATPSLSLQHEVFLLQKLPPPKLPLHVARRLGLQRDGL
jgi:hypothetical protein